VVGWGWGGMVVPAAANHGVRAVGVTLSRRQAEWAEKAVAEAGLADRVEIRYRDYRDGRGGPDDGISSLGVCGAVAAAGVLGRGAAAPPSGRAAPDPCDRPAAERRPHALPAQQLHRPLR